MIIKAKGCSNDISVRQLRVTPAPDNTIVYRMLETLGDSAEGGKTATRRKGAKEMSQVFDC